MTNTNAKEEIKLWECLNHWLEVVQHMLRRGCAPRGITEDAYIQLYRDLLAHVQSPTAAVPVDSMRQSLHHAVRPWVNLESLSRCDKRILRMLEREVRATRSQLIPRHYRQKQVIKQLAVAMIVLLLMVTLLGLSGAGDASPVKLASSLDSIWQYVDSARAQLWMGAVQSSVTQRLVALAGVIVVVGVFLLRDPKRY